MRTLATFAFVAVLAGCGQSLNTPLTQGAAQSRAHRESGSSGDVLFATADDISGYYVLVWSYPRGKFIRKLDGTGVGMCSDTSGNVWVADVAFTNLIEYKHNGNLEKELPDGFGTPWGCSVDPNTGNLATMQEYGGLVVFANASGSGTAYSTNLATGYFCAYDDKGNLFADGVNDSNQGELVELPKGSTKVESIALNQSIGGTGAVQWDGQYLAVQASQDGHHATIDQVQVSASTGTIVGTTLLDSPRTTAPLAQFWIQGNVVAEPTGRDGREIGLWKYPEGGQPMRVIERGGGYKASIIKGLTVSVASKH